MGNSSCNTMSMKLVAASVLSVLLVGCLLVVLSPTEVQTGSSIQDPTTALSAKHHHHHQPPPPPSPSATEDPDGVCQPGNPKDLNNPGYRWMFGTGFRTITKPVLSPDGKTLFVGSEDEPLYALHTADGTQRWKYAIGGGPSSPTVSINQKMVFFGADDQSLNAVNTADGTLSWKFSTGGGTFTPTESLDQKTVFAGEGDSGDSEGTVYAICSGDGTDKPKPGLTPAQEQQAILDKYGR